MKVTTCINPLMEARFEIKEIGKYIDANGEFRVRVKEQTDPSLTSRFGFYRLHKKNDGIMNLVLSNKNATEFQCRKQPFLHEDPDTEEIYAAWCWNLSDASNIHNIDTSSAQELVFNIPVKSWARQNTGKNTVTLQIWQPDHGSDIIGEWETTDTVTAKYVTSRDGSASDEDKIEVIWCHTNGGMYPPAFVKNLIERDKVRAIGESDGNTDLSNASPETVEDMIKSCLPTQTSTRKERRQLRPGTVCVMRITTSGDTYSAIGVSRLHENDRNMDKRIGRKISLQYAMDAAGIPRIISTQPGKRHEIGPRSHIWNAFKSTTKYTKPDPIAKFVKEHQL